MLPEAGNAALTGIGYGTLYGAGEGDGSERLTNAGIGGLFGGDRTAAPAVARGVGNAVNSFSNWRAPFRPPFSSSERGAVNRVADDMTSSGLTPGQYARQSQELGPQGMLLDMGEDLRGSAETLRQHARSAAQSFEANSMPGVPMRRTALDLESIERSGLKETLASLSIR